MPLVNEENSFIDYTVDFNKATWVKWSELI